MELKTLIQIKSSFAKELKDAANGKKNSLPFIIHEISPSPIVKDGETFQSLVTGGTVGQIATLKKNEKTIQILDKRREQLTFKTEEEFLDFINNKLPNNVNAIALNFAYPIKPVLQMEN